MDLIVGVRGYATVAVAVDVGPSPARPREYASTRRLATVPSENVTPSELTSYVHDADAPVKAAQSLTTVSPLRPLTVATTRQRVSYRSQPSEESPGVTVNVTSPLVSS